MLEDTGVQVVGLEIASQDKTYLWRGEASDDLMRYVIFPERIYEAIPLPEMWQGVIAALNTIRPNVIAVNGYSSHDSWAMMAWSRMYRRPIILMADSKADDAPRVWWMERLKQHLVKQFAAALCGGAPHKAYLEQLGLRPEQIFTGYDVVDNDYFRLKAEQARCNPGTVRHLSGLENPTPFFLASARFIERKNLDGLLRAYAQYRRRFPESGEGAPWRLVILGAGTEDHVLRNLAGQLGLTDVPWPGFRQVDELPSYYGLAGAFIHPALQEQWGLVVNEAMAAGLPVLVSNRCGCAQDLVVEGENGFTFDPEDHEALAELMMKLSCGQMNLAAMRQASLARIAEWGPNRFAKGLDGALRIALYARP